MYADLQALPRIQFNHFNSDRISDSHRQLKTEYIFNHIQLSVLMPQLQPSFTRLQFKLICTSYLNITNTYLESQYTHNNIQNINIPQAILNNRQNHKYSSHKFPITSNHASYLHDGTNKTSTICEANNGTPQPTVAHPSLRMARLR
jgi:hypothetical protein